MTDKNTTTLSPIMITLLAAAVGITAANLYYAQPIIAMISQALGLRPELAGLVVTLTQAGYGMGVLFIVPLGDIIESKKLILTMIGVTIFSLLGLAFVKSLAPYFLTAFITGLGASAVQILVPYAAHFSPEHKRGQVLGNLMSGLMIGIMLSRPISSLLTDLFNWHAVFILSALLMFIMGVVLYFCIPSKEPSVQNLKYSSLIKSMSVLYASTEILRRRAIYQAFLFGAFCLFWTASPLHLSGNGFHLSQSHIAIFALVGVAGAISSPFAGKAADKGWSRQATLLAMISSSLSFLIGNFFQPGSTFSLTALVMAAILLDAGITANLVLGQRAIFALPAEFRSRLNGLYIATIFIGGASGSALGAWAYATGGWNFTSWVGFTMPMLALGYFLTERKPVAPSII
jgi:predicted MFS family arabinose efflux permease